MGQWGLSPLSGWQLAARLAVASLRLDVLPNNIPAQRLYKRNGFIDHGFYHLYYGEGLLTDFYLMEYPFE